MTRIGGIRLREIEMPLREPFVISSGTYHHRRMLLVELTDAEGHSGLGECVAAEIPNYSPETIDTAWLAIERWIAPRVLDTEYEHPRELFALLARDIRGHEMARASVEMAAFDLQARRENVSFAQYLGGTRTRVGTGIALGIEADLAALAERIERCIEEGYQRIKLKIGPGKDVDVLKALRQRLANEVPLMVDANSAYSLKDLDLLRSFDEFNLQMIEQPFSRGDLRRHARLQQEISTPICLDESITSVENAEDMIALGSGRIVNIKPGRVGGFTSALAIHALCRSSGIPVWCGGMLESGIGRAHNVALASLPGFTLPGDLSPSARYWERDVVLPAWEMDSEGFVTVPRHRPGLGVDIDWPFIDRITTRTLDLPGT